ncbi:MAG: hypothetical protein QGG42_12215 [Phycisphaerae bacterium]|jgi:hypothetical protein|nr:hypothetical protein [Phycisphaerae bacterium]
MHDTLSNKKKYIRLGQAARIAPGRPSANCIWRWCRKGILSRTGQRIRLQHIRIGGKIFTTGGWLDEFGKSLAAADAEYFDQAEQEGFTPSPRPRTRGEKERQASIERAERDLEEAGV